MKRLAITAKNKQLSLALLLLGIFVTALLLIYFGNRTFDTIEDADAANTNSYKKWEEITLDFNANHAPLSQTSNNPNPFLDYRLTVYFTNNGKSYTVPGYFVGDGNGGTGNNWRVHFSADEEGTWTYHAVLQTGTNVAVNGGGELSGITPNTGSFAVSGVSNQGGFYQWCGRLGYVGEHYLQCLETGQYWIKGGTNSPENFLKGAESEAGYANIISALNYLSSQKVNSIYFLPMNLGGDGNDTYPFTSRTDILHYDTRKLSRWNSIFKEASAKEISLEFVLNEAEEGNRSYIGLSLGESRKLFYRELVARFSHHPAVKWVITEENRWTADELKTFASYIRSLDPYDHPISVHTNLDNTAFYNELLGDPNFDATSLQFTIASGTITETASAYAEEWRRKSSEAGRPWVVDLDEGIVEDGEDSSGMNSGNMDTLRRKTLYPALLSGGNISWYYGITEDIGLNMERLTSRGGMWEWMHYARQLLYSFPNRAEMVPSDHLVPGDTRAQVFRIPKKTYLVYLYSTSSGDTNAQIDLSEVANQHLTLRWFNPRTGSYSNNSTIIGGDSVELGATPTRDKGDWVAIITNSTGTAVTPTPSYPSHAYYEHNGLVVVQPENREIAGGWAKEKRAGSTGNGYIKWAGANHYFNPANGIIEYKLYISTPGIYSLSMRSNKKHPELDNSNDLYIKFDNGSWIKTANTHDKINEWTWSTFYIVPPGETAIPPSIELTRGVHSLFLAGRSNGFLLDRIHLYLPNVPNSTDLEALESEFRTLPLDNLACNSVCDKTQECVNNTNNFCSTQFNNSSWADNSSYVERIEYLSPSNGQVLIDTGTVSSLNQHIHTDGTLKQHLIKNGKVFYNSYSPHLGWDHYWIDVTSDFATVGTNFGGQIIGFNSYVKPNTSITEQHLLRKNGDFSRLYSRHNEGGEYSQWQDVTQNITVGEGMITSFTSHAHRDGYIIQDVVRGGRLWERTNLASWTPWQDITHNLDGCTGTIAGKCGTGKILSFKRATDQNNSDLMHLFREGGKVYTVTSIPSEKRCRLRTNVFSNTCSAPLPISPSPSPTSTPTATISPTISVEPSALCESNTVEFQSGEPYTNSVVTYKITLENPAPAPHGKVVVRDFYSDSLTILTKPSYCTQVAGINDIQQQNNLFLVFSIILLSSGLVVSVPIYKNKKEITIFLKKISTKELLFVSLLTVLIAGTGIIIYLGNHDVSPKDSSAGANKTLICNLPAGTKTIEYTARITGNVGQLVTNEATVFTGTTQNNTCNSSFTISGLPGTQTPPPTTPSNTPTVIEDTAVPTVSSTIDPTSSSTIVPTATSTIIPTPGTLCGSADIDGDNDLDIIDFGTYREGFASYYQKGCTDTEELRQTYMPCGGKDVVVSNDGDYEGRFGLIDIYDFQSFAQRYSSEVNPRSCDLVEPT